MKKMLALIIVIIINVCVWNCSSMLISRAKVHMLLISVGFKVHVSKIFASIENYVDYKIDLS